MVGRPGGGGVRRKRSKQESTARRVKCHSQNVSALRLRGGELAFALGPAR